LSCSVEPVARPKSQARPIGFCDRTSTVVVRPATRVPSAGIPSSEIGTGTHCASRTQLNVGFTLASRLAPFAAIAVFNAGSDALYVPRKRVGTARQADGDPITDVNARQFSFLEIAIHAESIGVNQSHYSLAFRDVGPRAQSLNSSACSSLPSGMKLISCRSNGYTDVIDDTTTARGAGDFRRSGRSPSNVATAP
jgi:hypothetical protein